MTIRGLTGAQIKRGPCFAFCGEPKCMEKCQMDMGRIEHESLLPSRGVTPKDKFLYGGIQVIDIIKAKLGPASFAQYCRGQALKHLLTEPCGALEMSDAEQYLEWARQELERK